MGIVSVFICQREKPGALQCKGESYTLKKGKNTLSLKHFFCLFVCFYPHLRGFPLILETGREGGTEEMERGTEEKVRRERRRWREEGKKKEGKREKDIDQLPPEQD